MSDTTNITGLFLTLEGDDGVGKSTQADLLASYLEERGIEVVRVHEPGDTKLGEDIRAMLLSKENENMTSISELLLYEAARAQLMQEVVIPALQAGKAVICDRFTDSTMAYQGFGREIGERTVAPLNDLACFGVAPTRTLLLLLDPEVAQARMRARAEEDRMEAAGEEFHERLRSGFSQIAANDPERVHLIDADGSIDEVQERIRTDIADLIQADRGK